MKTPLIVAFSMTASLIVSPMSADERIAVFVEKYCVSCHGADEIEADIDLRGPYDQIDLLKHHEVWARAIDQIEFEDMPPKKPLPSAKEAEEFVAILRQQVSEVDWTEFHDPGRHSLVRVTAVEYQNSIRDIFGIDLQAGYFLGRDPEGNTGFTNDRESLTFPLFAFDHFMREAERVVDAYLGYHKAEWQSKFHLPEVWEQSSDRSVELTEDGSAVLLKERNAPFQLNLDIPFAGIYSVDFEAATTNGEPIAAIHVMLNGESLERLVITGKNAKDYRVIASLPKGASVFSIGYDPDSAPIIQKPHLPRMVPKEISNQVLNPKPKKFPLPDHLKTNRKAVKAWQKLNSTIRDFTLTKRLADLLLETGEVDFETHGVAPSTRQLQRFGASKVPFNLAAGSVAVLMEIPQKQLEDRIANVSGFRHSEFAASANAYNKAWKKKHPDRIWKTPGRVELSSATVKSHSLPPGASNPREEIESALTSDLEREKFVRRLGTRAYGRKMDRKEWQVLNQIYKDSLIETGSEIEALKDCLIGLLVSPPFLLHYGEGKTEIAPRLSQFLWLSVPDQKLRSLADRGKLQEPAVVQSTIKRMIDDSRFSDMASQFIREWLDLDALSMHESSSQLKTHRLEAMKQEPVLLFEHVFRENRDLLELVDPDYTFLNDSLALHYEIPSVKGREFQRINLGDASRGGLLSMGAVLAATSTPERTSAVTRGAFIVELLLGVELPPPPPSVPELELSSRSGTVREELERHRDDKACSGCHEKIDPFGFVLEHYDQFGAWREKDRGKVIDASTELPCGTEVNGVEEFKDYLIEYRKDDFLRNLTVRLFEFALGREAQYSDEAMIRSILAKVKADGNRAQTLVREIVLSDAFQAGVNEHESED